MYDRTGLSTKCTLIKTGFKNLRTGTEAKFRPFVDALNKIIQEHNLLFGCLCLGYTQAIPFRKQDNNHSAIHSTTKTSHLQIEVELCYLRTFFVLFT